MFDPTRELISVIVPTFNAGPYLEQCLESILGQTHQNLEVLCLNDGSTDNSLEIMQRYADKDDRIRIIDKQNEGYGATCNRGLDEAQGSWIAIVEPDDWIELSMYADMLAFAATLDQTPQIIKTPYWRIWMPDTPKQRKLNCSYKNRIHPSKQPFIIAQAAHLLTHHPSIWSALYRKDFLDEHQIRFKPIPGAGWADNPFLIETLCSADAIAYLDTPYYCYREETPEKSQSFAEKSTMIPFERWNDMQDVLDRLAVNDSEVLQAHISRGFTYLSGVIEYVDLSHEQVYQATKAMFDRMDQNLVLTHPELSPGSKALYCEIMGIEPLKGGHAAYMRNLVKEGIYTIKNTGLSFTILATSHYLTHKKKREGRQTLNRDTACQSQKRPTFNLSTPKQSGHQLTS